MNGAHRCEVTRFYPDHFRCPTDRAIEIFEDLTWRSNSLSFFLFLFLERPIQKLREEIKLHDSYSNSRWRR